MKKSFSFTNKEIAKILNEIAAAYQVKEDNQFKVAAYQKAAVSVEHATSEIKDLWDDNKLDQVPGIGKNIASYLDELFRTGKVKHFEEIKRDLPPAMFEFLKIPGVGPKTAYALATKLNIKSAKNAIERLKKAAKEGKVRVLENFGEKSEKDLLEGIISLEKGELKTKRMLLPYADNLASEIVNYLKNCPQVLQVHPLGSLRRMVATIGDIDLSVCTKSPEKVIDYFLKFKKIRTVLDKGKESLVRVILLSGQQIDLRLSLPESYGAMLQYFTGSKQHNIELREYALKKGMSLSEYGIRLINLPQKPLKKFADEESFYQELGLSWIPPEIREGRGEIEAAKSNSLPRLIDNKEIKGDLHLHSNFDIEPSHDLGASSPEEMIEEALRLKYEYLGFSEHNPSISQHTEKQIIEILKRKSEFFEQIKYSIERVKKIPIKILNGLEIDIKPNGELALPEKAFDYLDYAIASIHTNFNLSREKMTQRVLRGLQHPKVKILGHPTGRLLEEREGYELDWDIIFDFCLKNNKFLEISAWPNRLDLPDILVKDAIAKGVKVVINSDSHHVEQMKLMKYGVAVARRGWAESKDVLNSQPWEKISQILNL